MLEHEGNTCFGVSSSLILRPSKRNLRDDTGTPTRSEYDFFSFPICVVIFTLKWISFESWPTTFNLMYSVSVLASACHKIRKIDFKHLYGTESNISYCLIFIFSNWNKFKLTFSPILNVVGSRQSIALLTWFIPGFVYKSRSCWKRKNKKSVQYYWQLNPWRYNGHHNILTLPHTTSFLYKLPNCIMKMVPLWYQSLHHT